MVVYRLRRFARLGLLRGLACGFGIGIVVRRGEKAGFSPLCLDDFKNIHNFSRLEKSIESTCCGIKIVSLDGWIG